MGSAAVAASHVAALAEAAGGGVRRVGTAAIDCPGRPP